MQVRGAVEPSPGADARDSVGDGMRDGLRRKGRKRKRRRMGGWGVGGIRRRRGRRRWGAQGTDYLPAWGRAQVKRHH